MPRMIPNRLKNMLAFNGSSDFLTLPVLPSTTGFNLAFWSIKRNFVNNARIIDFQDSGPEDGFTILEITGGKTEFASRNGAVVTGAIDSNRNINGELCHYVLTFDGTVAKMYENGVLVGTDSSSTMSAPSLTALYIGRRSASSANFWNGKLGELVFQNSTTPWTQAQVSDLYYNGIIPSGSSYWLFADDVLDGSGNGNHGTLTGGTYINTNSARAVATSRRNPVGNYQIKEGTLFEDFETIGDWSKQSSGGSIADETTIVKTGSHSLKLTSGDATNCFADKTISANLTYVGVIGFWVYLPTLTGVSNIAVYLSSTTNYSKYFSRTTAGTSLHEGWNFVEINRDLWSNSGSESWSNTFIRLRVRINASAGTPSCYFDGMYTGVYRRPKVLVTFDDSWDSQYSKAYSYMSGLGLKGTIYAIGSKLGTTNYCTIAQLREMYAAGWDIGNHGSVNLTTLGTVAEQMTEISSEEAYITEFERSKKHYAYPNGGYNNNALLALGSLGYKTARTIIDANQSHLVDNFLLLNRWGVYNTTSVATVQGYIDSAISRGNSILLNFHLIVDSGADVSTKVLTADFNSIMDYLKTKVNANQLDVVTISEWYNGLSGRQLPIIPRTAV